jgi:hypothetical protein
MGISPCALTKKGCFMAVDFPAIKAFSAASFEPFTKGLEAIAAETTDYSKKSFSKSQAFFEKLFGVKKFDEAIQLQSDFAKCTS